MRTRKVVYKNARKYLKIHKGGQSSDSYKSSGSVQQSAASASSPRKAASASSSPKAAAASPRRASSSPRAASSRSPARMQPRLRAHKSHSDGDGAPIIIDEDIMNKLRKISDKPASMTSQEKGEVRRLKRRIQERIPPAPPIELSPSGRGLLTSYTPRLDVAEAPPHNIPIVGVPSRTTPLLLMLPFIYNHKRPLPLTFLSEKKANASERSMMLYISVYPITYKYLSPIIYDILNKVNKRDLYAKVLIRGRLRDELIHCITITSSKALQSRLFMSAPEVDEFMYHLREYNEPFERMGASPDHPLALNIPNIDVISPDPNPIDPTSYAAVGYNKHPMFRTQPMTRKEEAELVSLSEKHKKIKREDVAFVHAHGAITNELSPEIKVLANKYFRIIEMGKEGQVMSGAYRSFPVKINEILRNPAYYSMFDNTDEGERTRKIVFDILCRYTKVDNISSCYAADTFHLTNITHDRFFCGHHEDAVTRDDRKITLKSIRNMVTLGIFVPVDYNLDKSTPYVARKELFKLYPGTTFFTKNTKMNLIETLLPIAIRENKRINIIIMSCAVDHIANETIRDIALQLNRNPKPGKANPAIEILTKAKYFLSKMNVLMDDYVLMSGNSGLEPLERVVVNKRNVFTGYNTYVADAKYTEVYNIASNIVQFYTNKYSFIAMDSYIVFSKVAELFSFSGINGGRRSNRLIEDGGIPLRGEWYYPYLNEIIKVKIFIMSEFLKVCSFRVPMITASLYIILQNVRDFRTMYGANPTPAQQATCQLLENAIRQTGDIFDYFDNLLGLLMYIEDGFNIMDETDVNSFMHHEKYREIKKEYDTSSAKEFYEEMVEGLDYDRYEGENVGFNERVYKASHMNPISPTKFRKTERFIYKHKVLPNRDEIRKRRKTMKKQLYEKYGIRSLAQKAKGSSGVSV